MNQKKIDEICDRFRASWNAQLAGRLIVAEVVEADADIRNDLLRRLISVDFDFRTSAGLLASEAPYSAIDTQLRAHSNSSIAALAGMAAEFANKIQSAAVTERNSNRFQDTHIGDSATGKAEATTREPDATLIGSDSELNRETSELSPTTTIGPYRIRQLIGHGGMGQVFLAEQTEPVKRRVALKIIKTDTPTKEILARFKAEQDALALMDHQNIAKVLDAGITDGGRPYFAMELVNGVTITEYCDKNRLTPNERLYLFVQTCRATQHAHQKGIIHRDLKPGNVLVTLADGKPVTKVIDFGLAKALQDTNQVVERTMFTQYGQVVGTLAYMSPEQAEMNAVDIDTRTDVYSLGVILYELLTGSTPVTKAQLDLEAFDRILAIIREEEVTRPSARLSESADAILGISEQRRTDPKRLSSILKGDLDWIVIKSLEKDRTRRYDTPAALADDVQRYLDDEAVEARPPSIGYRLQKSFRKHRGTFLAASIILALLVAGILGTGTMWYRATAAAQTARDSQAKEKVARADADAKRDRAVVAEATALKEKNQAESTLARSQYFLSIARWEMNRIAEAKQLLEQVPQQYRKFEWYLAKHEFSGSDLTLAEKSYIVAVDCSTNGSTFISGSMDGTVKIWDTAACKETRNIKAHDLLASVRISADGNTLVTAGTNGKDQIASIRVWDANTGKLVRVLTGPLGRVNSLEISQDGKKLLSTRDTAFSNPQDDSLIKVWDLETGDELFRLSGTSRTVEAACFSPDGRRIVSKFEKSPGVHAVKILSCPEGKELLTLECESTSAVALAYSPDGQFIAAGDMQGEIVIWEADQGAEVDRLFAHSNWIQDLQFSPDGAWLASCSHDRTVKIWDVQKRKLHRTLKGHEDRVMDISFNTDGSWLVSGSMDKTIKLWNLTSERRTLRGDDHAPNSLAISADGTRIAGGTAMTPGFRHGSSAIVWKAMSSQQMMLQDGHDGGLTEVAFNNDGSILASASGELGKPGTIKLWEVDGGRELRTITGHQRPIAAIAFSPTSQWLASGTGSKFDRTPSVIKIWDSKTGQELQSFSAHSQQITSLEFSSDGKSIVSASSANSKDAVRSWDAQTGLMIREFKANNANICSIAISPNCKRLAVGGNNFGGVASIELFEVSTGKLVKVLSGHEGEIKGLDFSPDSERLVSISYDKTVRLWDILNGKELRSLRGPSRGTSVGYCPEGQFIVAGFENGDVRVWDAPREDTPLTTPQITLVPNWHKQHFSEFDRSGNHFAATFHAAVLRKLLPNSRSAYDRLLKSWSKFPDANRLSAPLVILDAFELPKPPIPPLDTKQAANLNRTFWPQVAPSGAKPTTVTLDWIQAVARDFPLGSHFNTLGVAEYRAGNFQASIDACLKSVQLTPTELNLPGPYAGDLAFLAMSHFQLGHKDEAEEYRKQFSEAMKLAAFKDDQECIGFAEEARTIFSKSPQGL